MSGSFDQNHQVGAVMNLIEIFSFLKAGLNQDAGLVLRTLRGKFEGEERYRETNSTEPFPTDFNGPQQNFKGCCRINMNRQCEVLNFICKGVLQ